MSAHVLDQLSAYLDHELSVAEAAAVREHLAGCEACAARLAHLAAVDGRLRDLPAEAPAQYFDSFASRVRTRIETAHRPRVPFRVPAWTWAVAAAVLIAVVLPRMALVRQGAPASAPAKAPVAAAPATTSVPAPARADSPAPVVLAEAERLRASGYVQTPSADAKTDAKAEPTIGGASASPPLRKGETAPRFAGPPPAATPVPAESGRMEGFTAERADAAGAGATANLAAREASLRDEARLQMAEAQQLELEKDKRQGEDANVPARPVAADTSGRGEEQKKSRRAAAVGPMAQAPLSTADAEYRALGSGTAGASLAQEREAWRAFALRHSADPRADEARVRVVVLGVDLARRTGAEGDRAQARKDALDYLARKDAAQKERVRSLLEGLAP